MPAQGVPLTDWSGGLNNQSSIYTLDNAELAALVNLEFDVDGSLVGRPAIVPFDTISPPSGVMQPLGYYVRNDGVTFMVVASTTKTYLLNMANGIWLQIWTGKASGFVQYDNKVVLVSEAVAGGYWEANTFTSTPTMPLGSDIVFYQDRFWTFGVRGGATSTTVYHSNITVITPAMSIWDWVPATNFFTVNKGDGQWITRLLADTNALYIFRSGSTWKFSFPGSPTDGTLRQVNASVGADNKHCVVAYENYFMVLNQGFLHQFLNDRFYPLNQKAVRFDRSSFTGSLQHDVRLSLFGRRAIVSFYGNVYSYSILTSTWSTWDSPSTMASQFFMLPQSSAVGDSREAIVITSDADAGAQGLLHVQEDPLLGSATGEPIQGMLRTKSFDFGSSGEYKRLMFWEVEAQTATGIEGIAQPTTIARLGTTWNQMSLTTWNVLDAGSWNNPLLEPSRYIDDVEFPTQAPVVAVFKLTARLKFLRCYFEVFVDFDGTTRTSPTRVVSITPQLMTEAGVSRKVS